MRYLDFDLEIGPGVGREYPVSVRSTAGQTHGIMRFPFGELELENALLKLEKALLQSGGTRRKAPTEQEEDIHRFGQALFEALLEGDLRSLYYESKREATRQGQGLRLRLHIRAPELAALPWEYLYDPRVPDYLCLSRGTPLVRYLDLAHPIEPLTIAPPLQILAMIASPKDQEALDTTRERERMRQALEPLEKRGLIKITWLEGQTWRDLQRAMRGGPWHIFHFIGHGAFDRRADEGALALAEDDGQTYLLYATPLGRLLANHGTLRLVVLNACEGAKGGQRDLFSSTSSILAQRGIPAVLAMQYEISDRAAIELTSAFYEALADGMPVDAALAEARLAITLTVSNSLEWGTPVLFLRALDGVLFHLDEAARPPEPAVVTATVTPAPAAAPAQPSAPAEPAAASALPLAAPAPTPQRVREQWIDEWNVHEDAARAEEALATHERALALNPKDVWAWNDKGSTLHILQRDEEALAAYERALELNPKLTYTWNGKGNALYSLQRYGEALAAFERVLELTPGLAVAWNGKGNALYGLQRYREALAAFEQALEVNPKDTAAWIDKGSALYNLNRYTEALTAYERALELNPTYVFAWVDKAITLERLGRNAEAQQARQKARELGYTG